MAREKHKTAQNEYFAGRHAKAKRSRRTGPWFQSDGGAAVGRSRKEDLSDFGLSRGWYYKAAVADEIRMIAVRQRNSLRGVRLVVYDSVVAYIHRAADVGVPGQSGF